jgi:hypothetical protein
MNNNSSIYKTIKYLALAGNALYILWILYNAVDSGFQDKPVQIVALTGLLILLILNILLIYNNKDHA